MTSLFPIPDTWAWTTLGEIAEVVGGVTKDSKKQSDPSLPLVPYLRVANVQRGYLDLEKVAEIRVPERTVEKLRLRQGDVLMNEGGDRDKLGRGWVWNNEMPNCIHQNHVFRARLIGGGLDPKLLAWYINECARHWFEDNATQSVNLASISKTRIQQLPVPIPPTAEQRRIVAALEGHLSRLEASIESIQTALRRAKRLRLRFLNDCVTDPAGTWERFSLAQVVESVRNGLYVSRPGVEPDGIPILRIGSVRALQLDVTDIRYSGKSADDVDQAGYLLQPGDLLFTRYNGNPEYVGACTAVPEGIGALTYPDKLIRVRVDRSRVLPGYLAMACSAGETRAAIRRSAKTTAGQAGISGRELKSVPVRLPELDVQERMAQEFAQHDESVRRLELALTSAALKASSLRRSLLAEAFAGRLVEQDPADEPASVLLERIRAERVAAGPVRRTRRGKGEKAPQKETLL